MQRTIGFAVFMVQTNCSFHGYYSLQYTLQYIWCSATKVKNTAMQTVQSSTIHFPLQSWCTKLCQSTRKSIYLLSYAVGYHLNMQDAGRLTWTCFCFLNGGIAPSSASMLTWTCVLTSRGGNGSDADRIVPFPYPFPYFQNEYGCGYECCRIRIRSGCYSNTNTDRMFSQFGADTNIRK
jgi:hypothetical protein